MAQPGRLSDVGCWELLAANRTLVLGTHGHDGFPHLTTLWYAPDPVAGVIVVWSYARSQKIVNIRRVPRVSFIVEVGEQPGEFRAAVGLGRARVVDELREVEQIGRRILERGLGRGVAVPELESLGLRKRVGVEIAVERFRSWDHRADGYAAHLQAPGWGGRGA